MNNKVYFVASIRGGRVDAALYKRIIDYIKKTDIVLTEHIGKSNMSLKAQTRAIDAHIYARDTKWLKSCDLLIAECTCPSLGVGYELAYAEAHDIPVYIFYNKKKTNISAMLNGNSYFTTIPYEEEEEIYPEIDKILEYKDPALDKFKFMRKLKLTEAQRQVLEAAVGARPHYKQWVESVCDFLETTAPNLGEGGRCCSVFQSKPVLNKQPDVLFLGYNAHEDYGYTGIDRKRFWKGNPSFYEEGARYRDPWKIWYRPYNAMKFAHYTAPMEDGNFVFMNAVYFGSSTIKQLECIPNIQLAIDKCLEFTKEVIIDIFCPKAIVCFSISDCFDRLNQKFGFDAVVSFSPSHNINDKPYQCKKTIKMGLWEGIPVIGIPHPSTRDFSNDDWGVIAHFLKTIFIASN